MLLGFFIVALMVIAGCTSTQGGATTGNKIPDSGNTNVGPGSTPSLQSIADCKSPPIDPIIFEKFFPDVPGYKTDKKYQYIPYNKSTMTYEDKWQNHILVDYISSSETYLYRSRSVFVAFMDYGPCSDYNVINHLQNARVNGTVTRVNFHGYPAVHEQVYAPGGDILDGMTIGVTDRLVVQILVFGLRTNSFSQADADIENFGNAIDFSGFAASL
jgi:hypothetical protein